MNIRLNSSVDTDDLIGVLVEQLTREQLFTLIKDIDLTVADWDFTDDLVDYFNAEKLKFKSEQ